MSAVRKTRRARSQGAVASSHALAQPNRSLRSLWFPAALAIALAALSLLPRIAEVGILAASFRSFALFLFAWSAVLSWRLTRDPGLVAPSIEIDIRKQHYIQALVQFSVYAYWGYFWRPVYDHA